ncbi:MAG: trigger factor [Chloroflexota bacterium]|nr:trigger factor [Chloroflexota bacterium]MBI5704160.1 trigger factor [Chloroflexota bacterium]
MNIQKTIEENHEAKLVVEVEAEKIEQYKRRAARKIAERAKIPGFRPGKAPYHMVVLNYGEQAVLEQAIDMFVDDEYANILKEAGVEPGAAGTLEAIDSLDPVKLTFRVPLAPEVDLGDYHSLRMPYEWTAPSQEEVDKALADLRQMYATTENVEREAREGDFVLVDVKSELPELNREGFATLIRAEEQDAEWPYAGFAKELIGMKAGDVKTVKHTFPEDWDVEELKGKEAEMQVTVKVVRGVTLPELDDEFAKTVGAGETLDELKEAVKKDVEARSKAEYDDKYFVELIEKIKEGATFKYHQHSLDHESEHVLQDLSNRLAQQGMDLDTYFKFRNTTREKFIEEEVKPVAKKRLERSLILDEIVRREKLEVSNEALDAEFNSTIGSLIMQGLDMRKIQGGKKGQQEFAQAVAMESANRVLTRQALDLLKSIAIGEYKSPEERAAQAAEETSAEAQAEETEAAVPMNEAPSVSEGSSEEQAKS